jgi:hypothetical protein
VDQQIAKDLILVRFRATRTHRSQSVCDVAPFLKLKMKGDFAILLLSTSAAYQRMVLVEARAPTQNLDEPQQTRDPQRRREGLGRKAFSNREKVTFMARTISSQSLDTRIALPSSVA